MEETRIAPYSSSEDRISRLPDSLIHHILSSFDTKFAVQTSVLSKRWIDVWKSLPILRFNRSSFSEDKKDSFIMFVDMVLYYRKDDIQKFHVDWRESAHDNSVMMNVSRWSLAAVRYNVKDFVLVIAPCPDSPYEISHHLLNCKSLTRLEMLLVGKFRYVDIILPRSMNLPKLKVLLLAGLSISSVELSRLFSSCPVLESSHIDSCNIQTDNQRNFTVDSISLKKFEYKCLFRHLLRPNDTTANTIKLCAPNLECFAFTSLFMHDCILENYSPVSNVRFLMKLKAKQEDENAVTYSKLPLTETDVYARRTMKLLGAFYKVKRMRVSPGFLEVLSRAPHLLDCQPPLLRNLSYLVLGMWCTRGCFRAIAYLLKISPNITRLLLESKESNLAYVGDDWEAGLSLPGMLPHLKFVQIKEVEGCDSELKLVSFLLQNAKVLEVVALYSRSSVGSPDRVRQVKRFRDKLRALPTASSNIKMMVF